MKALLGAFNQEKALIGAFYVIVTLRYLREPSFEALVDILYYDVPYLLRLLLHGLLQQLGHGGGGREAGLAGQLGGVAVVGGVAAHGHGRAAAVELQVPADTDTVIQ